jgi:hypothetical protein
MTQGTLEYYAEIADKISWEGLDYYVTAYANESEFEPDPELQEAFRMAKSGLTLFVKLLYERIEQNGGDPDEFDVLAS